MEREPRTRVWTPYVFLAPALAVFGVFVLLPAAGTVALALTRWHWPHPLEWAGVENFRRLLLDDFIFHRALGNNAVYLALSLVFEVGLALVLALLLQRRIPGRGALRVLFFTPMVLPLVLVGFLFRSILRAEGGLANAALAAVGGPAATDWLTDARFALVAISAVSGWVYFGYFLILIQAGLGRVPRELIEAARLETDSAWRRFVHVTLPLLREVLAVCVLICATGAFRAFDLFYVLGGRSGGPGHITEIVPTWLVDQAFELKQYGYGCAIAVAMTAIVGAIAAVYLWLVERTGSAGRKSAAGGLEF
jgi:raffinose/stachyose/melibiose transport system permease protein